MSKQNLQLENTNDSKLLNSLKEIEPNKHLLHLSVLRQLSNKRAGTASTKTKSEVRGGGKKPWKQKGTGRARAGSIRSPLWVGGGITFGPKPRSFSFNIPKKASNLALAQALVAKANETTTLKTLPEIKDAKTKNFVSIMKSSGLMNLPLLIVASKKESNFETIKLASRNVQDVTFIDKDNLGVYDLLKAKSVIITEAASSDLTERLKAVAGKEKEKKEKKEKKAKKQ